MLQQAEMTPGWFARHCVWVDPCYNILTTCERRAFDISKAANGKRKRWMSEDQREYNRNMRASSQGDKQCQNGDRKVWWFVVLTRGRVHIEVMGHQWRQTGDGMAAFVDRLPQVLNRILPKESA